MHWFENQISIVLRYTNIFCQPQHIFIIPSTHATCFGHIDHPQELYTWHLRLKTCSMCWRDLIKLVVVYSVYLSVFHVMYQSGMSSAKKKMHEYNVFSGSQSSVKGHKFFMLFLWKMRILVHIHLADNWLRNSIGHVLLTHWSIFLCKKRS
jgi:hypothetical protein